MAKRIFETRAAGVAAHLIGAALLLWVALANGFPLLFADSGTYLRIGSELYYPLDRPASYGLLMLPFARTGGLWAVAVAQAVAATALIGLVLRTVIGSRHPALLIAIVAGLALFSSLPWFVGQLMPDVMTGFVALTIFLIFHGPRDSLTRWALPLLLAGLCACHLSHIPLALILVIVAAGFAWATSGRGHALRAAGRGLAGIAIALLGLSAMNLVAVHRFAPSLAGDRFLLARLLDGRVAQPVLDDLCRTRALRLCAVRPLVEDAAIALPGQAYLWDTRSPRPALEAAGADELATEEKAVIRRTLRERPGAVLRLAITGWGTQLVTARTGDGMVPYPPGTQIFQQIIRHFPREAGAFIASRQQRGRLQALAVMPAGFVALLAAFLWPLILGWSWRRHDRLAGLAMLIGVTILGNAAITGILSGPFDRYQNRVLWLLPMLAFIALARRFSPPIPSPSPA